MRIWTVEEIKALLENNNEFVCRALKKLYERQTEEEQNGNHTDERNGVGFNRIDAEFMTSVAKYLIEYGSLTDKQLFYVRKKIMKYAGQLTKIANAAA